MTLPRLIWQGFSTFIPRAGTIEVAGQCLRCGLARSALFHAIAAQDFEGIVAKRVDAPYKAGRQPVWLKIKNRAYSRRAAVEWQGSR